MLVRMNTSVRASTTASRSNSLPYHRLVFSLSVLVIITLLSFFFTPCFAVKAPCAQAGRLLSSSLPLSPSAFVACLKSVPFVATRAAKILDTLKKSVELYAYLDIAKNAPDSQLPSHVDLKAGLAAIGKTRYADEYSFHVAINDLFESLKDGHTGFTSCFVSNALYYTLVPLVSVVEGGKQKIIVASNAGYGSARQVLSTEQSIGGKLSTFANAEVVQIEGKNALSFVTDFAQQQLGEVRDVSARFNLALGRMAFSGSGGKGKYGVSFGFLAGAFTERTKAPNKDWISYTVRKVGSSKLQTVRVPFFVSFAGAQFQNSNQFYQGNCAKGAKAKATFGVAKSREGVSTFAKGSEANDLDLSFLNDLQFRSRTPLKAQALTRLAETTPLLEGGEQQQQGRNERVVYGKFVSVILLKDAKAAVVVLPDFLGPNLNGTELVYELIDVSNSIDDLLFSKSATRILLHLSDNPGGNGVIANLFLQILFGADPKTIEFPMQLRASSLALSLVRSSNRLGKPKAVRSPYFWKRYLNLLGNPFPASSSFFFPLLNSFGFVFSKKMLWKEMLPPFLTNVQLVDKATLAVVTNGFCVSSCSNFLTFMEQKYGIPVFGVGGLAGRAMAQSGLCVGSVYKLSWLLDQTLNPLGMRSNIDAPQAFPINSDFEFVLGQAFAPASSSVPCDFSFRKTTAQVPYTRANVMNVFALWRDVVSKMQ